MMHAQHRLRHEQTIRREACKVCGGDGELFDVLDFARTCDA